MRTWSSFLGALLAPLALAGCPGPAPADGGDARLDGPAPADATDVVPRDAPDADAARDGGNAAGRPCTDDAMCAGNGTYTCDRATFPGFRNGICAVTPCTQSMAQGDEQRECGGRDTTCLTYGIGQTFERTSCTRACQVGAALSARSPCAPDQICTTWNLFRGGPDTIGGCAPFCHSDAECADGQHCDRRGACRAAPIDMALRPDGEPCNPMLERANMPSPQCRGYCFSAGPMNTQGICGGYLDRRRPPNTSPDGAALCYDNDPNVVPRGSFTRDDMVRCLWRTCFCNAECPAGLICSQVSADDPSQGGVCTYRNPAAMPAQVILATCPDAGVDGGDAGRDATSPEAGSDAAPEAASDAAPGDGGADDAASGLDAALD